MKFNIKKRNKGVVQQSLLLLALVMMLGSCTKFLKENPTANLTSDYTFTTAAEGTALVVGGYRSLSTYTGGGGDYGNYLPSTLEYLTGLAWSSDSHPLINKFQSNQLSGSTLSDFDNFWNNNYQGVKDCNNAIAKIPGIIEWTPNDKSNYMGQVRTLRALYYFNLVRYYGDVVMDTALSTFAESQQPRASLKTIYDEIIIPDLEFAVSSNLADVPSTGGYVTKLVARAILADVYLTCAGYPYQEVATDPAKPWCTDGSFSQSTYPVNTPGATSFLQKAAEQLNLLYGRYTMVSTYRDLHNPSLNNKGESIFQIQYISGVNEMTGFMGSLLPPAIKAASLTEYGTLIPTIGYYNSYTPGDLRTQERQMFYTKDNVATQYDATNPPVNFDQPYVFKYYDSAAFKTSGGHSGLNFTLYRYSDILLMLTEVNWTLRQNGISVADDDVLKGINAVRARAQLPAYRIGDINLLSIFSERAWELIFENKMLWDQRRTRKCLIDGVGSFSGIENFVGHQPVSFNFKFSNMNLLSPISQAEIANNSKCLQNFNFLPKQVGQ
ncbi:RagB/SusD family nutrient uptake outer membrane protein [Ferruginibacter paludis]|uniref:RagB/SusD family nutrient uptake outer membrane protein n=1 Tax=Ferruginibacter paludis TaxID=1310417 RepID=UPI0025B56727|nr:RagB/SusD family nutrient uptake outer membrane protein [Ferruginibacter paludis]MDN3659414.1 RagB/SusD family nutrient uptake outer membrane protein [Ferruginibacter paludis]